MRLSRIDPEGGGQSERTSFDCSCGFTYAMSGRIVAYHAGDRPRGRALAMVYPPMPATKQ